MHFSGQSSGVVCRAFPRAAGAYWRKIIRLYPLGHWCGRHGVPGILTRCPLATLAGVLRSAPRWLCGVAPFRILGTLLQGNTCKPSILEEALQEDINRTWNFSWPRPLQCGGNIEVRGNSSNNDVAYREVPTACTVINKDRHLKCQKYELATLMLRQ